MQVSTEKDRLPIIRATENQRLVPGPKAAIAKTAEKSEEFWEVSGNQSE